MADLTGERLGPFEITALVGTGGFATVYRAYDPRLQADVAIKVLAENHALNADVRARFLQEAKALRSVDSPSVITVHDIRETPSAQPFLVLEHADRGNLSDRRHTLVEQGWRPEAEDVRLLVGVLGEALDAIHTARLVHRDITPSNLLIRSGRRRTSGVEATFLQPDERVLVSDLGLAKDLGEGSGLTLGGGTSGFSAPEQRGSLTKVDYRTDIYGASSLVAWFLTGTAPATQSDLWRQLDEGGWPRRLGDALAKGRSENPDHRQPSIVDWRYEVESALTPVASPPSRTTRKVAGFTTVAVLLAGAIFALPRILDDGPDQADPDQADPDPGLNSTELVVGYDDSAPSSNRERPELFQPTVDPNYGTRITRINDPDADANAIDVSTRRQTENADGSFILTFHGEEAGYRVNDRADGSLIRNLGLEPESTPHWHPTDSTRLRHLAVNDLRLFEVDVTTGESEILVDLTEPVQAVFPTANFIYPRKGGEPSADGSRYAWFVFGPEQEDPLGALTYDLSTDNVLGTLMAADFPGTGLSAGIGMAASGEYVVISQADVASVFDADLTNQRRIFGGDGPNDLAVNKDGGDSYVYVNFGADNEAGWLVSADLQTLTHTLIFNLFRDANTQMDVSGRGFGKPGWVVASSYDCKVDGAWTCDKIMAVEMEPDGRVVNLAHTYSCLGQSWFRPQAVPNQDFTRIYFASDNGACGSDAELMVIDVPPFD